MKKILISVLISCLIFSSLFNTAYASENFTHLNNEFYFYESEDVIYINHGENTTTYDTLTGNVYAMDGRLVGCVFTMDSNDSIDEYSRAVKPPIRQAGNRLSGLTETAYASLLA